MPKLTDDTKRERETTIRWDETNDAAILFTASIPIRNEWKELGYNLVETFGGGWRTEVSKDRISFKPLKKVKKG